MIGRFATGVLRYMVQSLSQSENIFNIQIKDFPCLSSS